MDIKERIKNYPRHPSQRGEFGYQLYKHMAENKDIWLLTGDLGFGMFDPHRDDFPDRFVNCGAAEQAMMGIAVGLALEGKIPFVFSITNFVLYRPYEVIRNYINEERIPVKIVASGRGKDYEDDGFTHMSTDAKLVLQAFPNIHQYWPKDNQEVGRNLREMILNGDPSFISLTRK